MVKNEDVSPIHPPSPYHHEPHGAPGGDRAFGRAACSQGTDYPKQVNDNSLGVQETASRIPSRRTFEGTENWVVFKAPISKLGSSQIVEILLVFGNCSERLLCWVAATSVRVCFELVSVVA